MRQILTVKGVKVLLYSNYAFISKSCGIVLLCLVNSRECWDDYYYIHDLDLLVRGELVPQSSASISMLLRSLRSMVPLYIRGRIRVESVSINQCQHVILLTTDT